MVPEGVEPGRRAVSEQDRNDAASGAGPLPVLVAGGGIGGLAVALALANNGLDVEVLERSSSLGEIGAGIQLGPNAFHAFDALGVGDAVRSIAIYIDQLRLMDAVAGEEITHIPVGAAFRERFGNPYAVVHRGELHGVLLRCCRESPRVTLTTGASIDRYDQDGASVTATLADGRRVTGGFLIGADGLWSKLRARIAGDGPPRVSGHTSYRSVIAIDDMPEEFRWNSATLWAGPKSHVVHYPLSGWKRFNLVATYHNHAEEPTNGVPVARDEVLDGFGHLHPSVRRILERGKDWKRWVLCDREPTERWIDGRVVLLGDAAHPTLQYLAQGACMALEDAVCLADMVARHDRLDDGLEAYRARRLLRTARVQLESRAIGDHIYHPAGVHAALRDHIMRKKSAEDWYDTLDWLYGTGPEHRPLATGVGADAIRRAGG